MNHTITPASFLAPLLPPLAAIVAARNGPPDCDRFELEDTVLRAYRDGAMVGAWDIGAEAAPLHAEIARLTEEKRVADEAAEAARRAYELANPQPWRVSKDTLIGRVLEAGALPQVMAALASQSPEQQFVFAQSAWFWSNNATLRGLCAALGLDADAILAPDPYL
jgi:hypothetical protein